MIQSTLQAGWHVGVIMDGNGRWAAHRGLPRLAGHRAGAEALRRAVEAAPHLGIGTLTVYAFSSDNWQRPPAEVGGLMELFRRHLISETAKCKKQGVRLSVIGRRDRLAPRMVDLIEKAEASTKLGKSLHLRIAVDYSARDAILAAAKRLQAANLPTDPKLARERFGSLLGSNEVDFLIRTGGERRLSDFLLWESAYAELIFLDVMWPDFSRADLEGAVNEFLARERRFGRVTAAAAAAV